MINRKKLVKLYRRWVLPLIGTLLLYSLLLLVAGQRIYSNEVGRPAPAGSALAVPNLLGADPVLAAQTSPFDWSYPTRILKRARTHL